MEFFQCILDIIGSIELRPVKQNPILDELKVPLVINTVVKVKHSKAVLADLLWLQSCNVYLLFDISKLYINHSTYSLDLINSKGTDFLNHINKLLLLDIQLDFGSHLVVEGFVYLHVLIVIVSNFLAFVWLQKSIKKLDLIDVDSILKRIDHELIEDHSLGEEEAANEHHVLWDRPKDVLCLNHVSHLSYSIHHENNHLLYVAVVIL